MEVDWFGRVDPLAIGGDVPRGMLKITVWEPPGR